MKDEIERVEDQLNIKIDYDNQKRKLGINILSLIEDFEIETGCSLKKMILNVFSRESLGKTNYNIIGLDIETNIDNSVIMKKEQNEL